MTIRPGKEDLAFFDDLNTVEKFSEWLCVGLDGMYLAGRKTVDFGPIGVFLTGSDQAADGLAALYKDLRSSSKKQSLYRQAVAKLVESCSAEQDSIPIFEQLLRLAGKMPAPEVVPKLAMRISKGFFGQADIQAEQNLFRVALTIVSQMAAPAVDRKQAIKLLMTSENYDDRYAPRTLIALCRADREGFLDHMIYCEDYLIRWIDLHAGLAKRRSAARDLVKEITKTALQNSIRDFVWWRLDPALDPGDPLDWLLLSIIDAVDIPERREKTLVPKDVPVVIVVGTLPNVKRIFSKAGELFGPLFQRRAKEVAGDRQLGEQYGDR